MSSEKAAPLEHVVRVFRCSAGGVKGGMSISRPFPTQEEAEDFYERTVSVHLARANRERNGGYIIVLATQDARAWKKAADRNFTVVKQFVALPGRPL